MTNRIPLSKRAMGPDPFSTDFCRYPIEQEQKSCPSVRLVRYWVADDGKKAACKLLVCNEIHVWVWQNGVWKMNPHLS